MTVGMTTTDGRGARVLVAEDDTGVRETLDAALSFEGYRVTTVPDGAAALAALAEEPPDLLVLDIGMPRVDGLTVCRMARERGIRLPILILTARQEVSDRVAGLDAGADDYLAKPFALDELLARARALLRRTGAAAGDDVLTVADLALDPARRIGRPGGTARWT